MVLLQQLKRLLGCIFCWHLKPAHTNQAPQAILACTFGRNGLGLAGKSNEAIAQQVQQLAASHNVPSCVQAEVSRAMPEKTDGYVSACSHDMHGKGYVGTRETVLEMIDQFCKPNNIVRVAVVAHPHHLWRVVRVCEKLGLVVVSVATDNIPYDPESTQAWCRSAWNYLRTFPYPPFILYEILARIHYLRKGWL